MLSCEIRTFRRVCEEGILPSSDVQGAPDFAESQGKPLQKKIQTRVGASALPAIVPGRQQRVDSWASDMSEIEAFKLISNIKFEDEAAVSTPLGPDTVSDMVQGFRSFSRAELPPSLVSCTTTRGRATLGLEKS